MRSIDLTGWVFMALFAVLALGAGTALIILENVPLWWLAFGLMTAIAFLAAGATANTNTAPKNMHVHGAARPASEAEAQAVARGDRTGLALHDRTFSD